MNVGSAPFTCFCWSAVRLGQRERLPHSARGQFQPRQPRGWGARRYLSFTIPDVFVCGYGLDRTQCDPNLPFIAVRIEED